ncbi:hypothetical protein Hypma_014285 [Hypsizygus marmoreus]|uniref:Uncharacterized protein n=1 Tax=Hypsizygus marmoreus TaxID=39966 RepID=A0A369JAZ8_HYPMA|nr:hypothetical protein Hypma_014285 [Hypsizygus marmoreus]
MFFSKVFVALAAIVVVAASPVKRAASCSYTLTPTASVSGDLFAEFNYTLSRALLIELPDGTTIYGPGTTYTDNGDGTYSVEFTVSSEAVTDEEIAAIIIGLAGETLLGITADWHVDTVTPPQNAHNRHPPHPANTRTSASTEEERAPQSYYQFQISSPRTASSSEEEETTPKSRWVPEDGVVKWISTKAADTWAGLRVGGS